MKIRGFALLVGFLAVAILVAACTDDAVAPQPTISPVAVTPTEERVRPEEAREQLLLVPNVGDALRAIEAGDHAALLTLVDWLPHACGTRASDPCPAGVVLGVELLMVNVGFFDTYLLTEETLRVRLAEALAAPIELTFASRQEEPQDWRGREVGVGDLYFVGFEGPPRPSGWLGEADDPELTGLFMLLDSGSRTPIIEIGPLTETWTAADQGSSLGSVIGVIITPE